MARNNLDLEKGENVIDMAKKKTVENILASEHMAIRHSRRSTGSTYGS